MGTRGWHLDRQEHLDTSHNSDENTVVYVRRPTQRATHEFDVAEKRISQIGNRLNQEDLDDCRR